MRILINDVKYQIDSLTQIETDVFFITFDNGKQGYISRKDIIFPSFSIHIL